MRYLWVVALVFLSCDDPKPEITPNPDATATFNESILLAFQNSRSIRIDSTFTKTVQENLKLARTLDIELQEIHKWDCFNSHYLDIYFEDSIDVISINDSCEVLNSVLNSILVEYDFIECLDWLVSNHWGDYGYSFRSTELLNLPPLAEHLNSFTGVSYAMPSMWDCNPWQCSTIFLSVLDDVYTFKFFDSCDSEEGKEWVIVVLDGEATLISKS
ncbi:MAG: hypothetical protein HQ556_04135 [Candidatus Marinimicrobia bacterium]|nr:hypothetical protein [Candidatus Neomarinimicrobiota bacterium]